MRGHMGILIGPFGMKLYLQHTDCKLFLEKMPHILQRYDKAYFTEYKR